MKRRCGTERAFQPCSSLASGSMYLQSNMHMKAKGPDIATRRDIRTTRLLNLQPTLLRNNHAIVINKIRICTVYLSTHPACIDHPMSELYFSYVIRYQLHRLYALAYKLTHLAFSHHICYAFGKYIYLATNNSFQILEGHSSRICQQYQKVEASQCF